MITALEAGDAVLIDGLVAFMTSLSGSFNSPDHVITKNNAHLNVNAREVHALQAAVAANARYSRDVAEIKMPVITSFLDVASNTFNLAFLGTKICPSSLDWSTFGNVSSDVSDIYPQVLRTHSNFPGKNYKDYIL